MVQPGKETAITALYEHRVTEGLLEVHFEWNDELSKYSLESDDTYTMHLGRAICMEASAHFVGRIYQLGVSRYKLGKTAVAIEHYFGKNVAQGLRESVNLHILAGQVQLSDDNRDSLARLELHDPGTPLMLRNSCAVKLAEPRPLDRPPDSA